MPWKIGIRVTVAALLIVGSIVGIMMVLRITRILNSRQFEVEEKLLQRAAIEIRQQQLTNALATLNEVKELGGCNSTCLFAMGRLELTQLNFEAARSHCKSSLINTFASPWPCTDPNGLRCLLYSHVMLDQYHEAETFARKLQNCGRLSEDGSAMLFLLEEAAEEEEEEDAARRAAMWKKLARSEIVVPEEEWRASGDLLLSALFEQSTCDASSKSSATCEA